MGGKRPRQTEKRTAAGGQQENYEDDVSSDFSSDEEHDEDTALSDDGEDDTETADAKRLRLAKQYLRVVRTEEAAKFGEDEANDAVENRLTRDVLESQGRYAIIT